MRSLVVFYTRSGNTGLVAHTIKRELKSHIKEITDYTNYRSTFDYLFTNLIDSASINPRKLDIDYYDYIFIGTPVWFGSMTPAIKKIIDNTDFKNKNIILFNTMKIGGNENAMKKMVKEIRKQNGKVVGAFSIRTNCSDLEIMARTREAIHDLNFT